MKLLGVDKDGNDKYKWLYSEWALTYRVGWGHICSAASLIWHYTEDPVITTGDASGRKSVDVKDADGILKIEEAGWLCIRGTSEILKVPVEITFHNQTDLVRVSVLSVTKEFMEADYKNFNLSMCQFMDSIELAMYN